MEIRHLITFQTIVNKGSYTEAAYILGYTQSTITAHMQALEQEIGGELFTYKNRNLHLTTLGKELIPLSEDLLSTHEQIKNMRNNNKVSGVLRIAAPESLTISKLGPIIKEYSMRFPDVKLILTNGTCGQNQNDLMSGRVDIAFMLYPKIKPEKCIHYVLCEEKIVLVGNKEGPQHFNEIKSNSSNHFFITNEEGCSFRTIFERQLIKHDIKDLQTMELWSIGAIKQMIMNGLGFSVLPYITVKDEIESGKIRLLAHSETMESIYSHMLIKKKKWITPQIQAFTRLALASLSAK
ncbi:LysR family transcriptional regulator [Niallia taxi]|uniref:LysR family transcriptional regulator n=1 Tax=Niallia taxi TaxID=2499688 RepID=UPI0021A578AD|nr:LysR family transcriptional regulator [Niallia taxi]MCT2347189.1 LysR family transcriptional regulator [Niallia taxi]